MTEFGFHSSTRVVEGKIKYGRKAGSFARAPIPTFLSYFTWNFYLVTYNTNKIVFRNETANKATTHPLELDSLQRACL